MTAPYAPLLGTPANLAYLDADGGFVQTWSHRPAAPGDVQAQYRYRRRIAGSTTYEWWTGATWALVSTDVASGAEQAVIPPGVFPNGDIYQVAVATRNAGGEWSPYSPERVLIASEPPTLTLTGPPSPVLGSRPTISYVYSDAEGHAMESLRLVVYPQAVWSAGDFDADADLGLALWDSGKILRGLGDEPEYPVGVDLPDDDNMRVYGRAWQIGDQPSPWAHIEFNVTLTVPNPPGVVAIADNTNGEVDLAVAASLNLLTADEADFESAGPVGWEREGYGHPERSDEWASNGTQSLKVTAWSTFDAATAAHAGDSYDDAAAGYPTFDAFAATLF